jgi:hypothetical protein
VLVLLFPHAEVRADPIERRPLVVQLDANGAAAGVTLAHFRNDRGVLGKQFPRIDQSNALRAPPHHVARIREGDRRELAKNSVLRDVRSLLALSHRLSDKALRVWVSVELGSDYFGPLSPESHIAHGLRRVHVRVGEQLRDESPNPSSLASGEFVHGNKKRPDREAEALKGDSIR